MEYRPFHINSRYDTVRCYGDVYWLGCSLAMLLGKFRVATAIHSTFLIRWFSFIVLSAWWQSNTDYDAFTA